MKKYLPPLFIVFAVLVMNIGLLVAVLIFPSQAHDEAVFSVTGDSSKTGKLVPAGGLFPAGNSISVKTSKLLTN